MNRTVVLDIEGTVSPISAVQQQLFPYARAQLAAWVRRIDPEVIAVVEHVRAALGNPTASLDAVAAQLTTWSDADVKAGPLKTLQGLIWRDGFDSGELQAVLYPDVPPALDGWAAVGTGVYVYSSGSELAQRLWFAHTQFGDFSDRIRGHFDTKSAGPKWEPHSYHTIAASIDAPPQDILFLSDALTELNAAREAGWQTLGVSRPEDGAPDLAGHPSVTTLNDIAREHLWSIP
jgi:enolase-phosphatase E1